MSDSLQPHGPQHARLSCSTLSLGVCSNSCPLSYWRHPTVSSCHPLFHLPSIVPSIRVFFNESALHTRWQSIRASASVLPMNIQGWFPTGLVWSLCCPRTLKSVFQHHSSKPLILQHSAFFMVQLSHLYVTRKTVTLTIWMFAGKVMSLLSNMLPRFVIDFYIQTDIIDQRQNIL